MMNISNNVGVRFLKKCSFFFRKKKKKEKKSNISKNFEKFYPKNTLVREDR